MKTTYYKIDARRPQPHLISRAVAHIKAGEVVAFPTETVYGLGADAFQTAAIDKIFTAKGRPSDNPLLIHVSNLDQVKHLAAVVPPAAVKLMQRFWPGPLSMVLPALPSVPEVVRGGRTGVGLRMPSHPVAMALIEAAGPLAAPSANRYGRPSPTSADHVRQDLDGLIAAVLDAGETGAGLESTLVDLTDDHYRILRRGGIRAELIEECLGQTLEYALTDRSGYQSPIRIVLSESAADLERRIIETRNNEIGIVYLGSGEDYGVDLARRVFTLDVAGDGQGLYSIIREAEAAGIEILLFAPFDTSRLDEAWLDRLHRAAHK
ncbi:MAG TPA: L-threonylcarbamoyladenylate synthase [Syntrophomonadaceae bacterium]|jgi:L-threonylcarbamoyladenylate synthase|nr:L-threonylcarbamoyladenylate synthase [Syntrophomonadaceae bacterium]